MTPQSQSSFNNVEAQPTERNARINIKKMTSCNLSLVNKVLRTRSRVTARLMAEFFTDVSECLCVLANVVIRNVKGFLRKTDACVEAQATSTEAYFPE